MSQQDSSSNTDFIEMIFYVADLSAEQRQATGIKNDQVNYVAVYHYKNEIKSVMWFFRPDKDRALYLNSNSWLELQLIAHLPWKDILKYFVDAKEHKND